MWDLNGLAAINSAAYALALQGEPEHEAVSLATDPRKQNKLIELLWWQVPHANFDALQDNNLLLDRVAAEVDAF